MTSTSKLVIGAAVAAGVIWYLRRRGGGLAGAVDDLGDSLTELWAPDGGLATSPAIGASSGGGAGGGGAAACCSGCAGGGSCAEPEDLRPEEPVSKALDWIRRAQTRTSTTRTSTTSLAPGSTSRFATAGSRIFATRTL